MQPLKGCMHIYYKGILLVCVAAEECETVIEKRLKTDTEDRLQNQQSGFRKNHNR